MKACLLIGIRDAGAENMPAAFDNECQSTTNIKALEMIWLFLQWFQEALDYRTDNITDNSFHYEDDDCQSRP